jgi:hypothetical protein
MPYQSGGAPPGLRGYLMSRQNQQVEQQQELQGLMGMLRLKQAQEEAAQRAQMQPLQMELMKAQVEAQREKARTAPQRAEMEAALNQMKLEKARREGLEAETRQAGLSGLLQQMTRPYQSPQGVAPTDGSQGPPDMVAPNDQAAIQALQSAGGRPMKVDVANPALTQAYQVMANPQRAIPELIKQQSPQTANESPIARVMRERASLPPGDPRGPLMDKYIEKLTSHQPGVAVYSGSLTPGVDAQGNPVFVQPSNREGVEPRVVQGVRPMPKPADEKAAQAEREAEATVESVRDRIKKLSTLIQQNPTAVGIPGMVRRGVEAASGVSEGLGGPSMPTPAIDFTNQQALLLADIRKLVEKDPNLSNHERETLKTTLGGGIFQTPGSSIRAMNNVLEYVERKKLTGKTNTGVRRIQSDADYNALPSGTEFIAPDGSRRRKP